MAKVTLPSESDKKKQAGELIKNADKLLKANDPASAFQAIEQALQLDPGNLYGLAYRERIKSALAKAGIAEPEVPAIVPQVAQPPVEEVPPPPPPKPKVEKAVEPPPAPVKVEPTKVVEPPKVVQAPVKPPAPEKIKPEQPPLDSEATGKMRKLAAIMFTDMVGYTSLTQANESLAIKLLDTQQKLIRPVLSKFDGKEIKTVGDAFLAEFVSVLQAARCALDIQKVIIGHNTEATQEQQIQLRIGIHLGDIIYKDNDIYGDGVNIASRIQSQAPPGGIYVSQDVYNQIRNRDEFIIEYVGEIELKNILAPVPIYRILNEREIRIKEEEEATKIAISEGIQEAQAKKIQDFLTSAREFEKKNALREALAEVTKILQINSQHPEARLIDSQIRKKRIELIGKQIEETRKPPRDQMLEWYKEALHYALKEGEINKEELKILGAWRTEIHLTDQDHEMLMKEIAGTKE